MKLCDLHTHVLPGVDDGAPTMEYALQMLRNAAASDVEVLAVTPHCNVPQGPRNYLEPALTERFSQLRQAASDIPVELVLGAEVFVTQELAPLLKQGLLPRINGGRYLLTEFPMDTPPEAFCRALEAILEENLVPVVAHPERYRAICREPELVIPWLDMGCHLQLTGGSVMGSYGKAVQNAAAFLLRNDLVACIASDAHGTERRSNFLLDVCDHLSVRYSRSYARCLMYTNPLRICRNEPL